MSGGERSYSKMALVVALGSQLDTTFRAMDEIDIFMDSVIRRFSLKVHFITLHRMTVCRGRAGA